jgi:ABC-2 type transport system ATP-binding protein
VEKEFGRVPALRGIDLAIPSGRRVALIGPNGSGKSTLIRSIMGLLSCEGSVLLDGHAPFEDRVAISRKLAYVPQVAPQLSASVNEMIEAVVATRGVERQRIVELARRLDLDVRGIGEKAFRTLSGGMKQKLLIALAFAAPASLFILDEPTASLDATARERFFRLFDELPPETTVILCSHRLEEMRHLAHHVVELADGKVVYDGPIDHLLAQRSRCVVEVCVESSERIDWLITEGFRAGAPGWWTLTVTHAEKMRVVPALTKALNGTLRNLLVRDLETIEPGEKGKTHA